MNLTVIRREEKEVRFPGKTSRWSFALLILAGVAPVCAGCRSVQRHAARSNTIEEPQPPTEAHPLATHDETKAPPVLPSNAEEPDRWLVVEKAGKGVPGAWATGSFDPKRNKISIQTQDVQQFTIDMSEIPIDWNRLVVLGIDGANSELRKRDYDVYRFARDEHGRWVVVEP